MECNFKNQDIVRVIYYMGSDATESDSKRIDALKKLEDGDHISLPCFDLLVKGVSFTYKDGKYVVMIYGVIKNDTVVEPHWEIWRRRCD